jgi:dTMP kinase
MLLRASFQPWTMACLMSADRAEHVQRMIRPALDAGQWVVCDRFTDSTLAYQGGGLGVPMDALRMMNEAATGGLRPHLTLLFDLSIDLSLARVAARAPGSRLDRFESAERAFHERVRDAYLAIARAEPDRVRVIDADADPDAVFARVREAVAPLLAATP